MATSIEDQQRVSEIQAELLPGLLEGHQPGAYVVIPVDVLSRQLSIDWHQTEKEHRGTITLGHLQVRHLRSLMQLGAVVNTRPGYDRTADL